MRFDTQKGVVLVFSLLLLLLLTLASTSMIAKNQQQFHIVRNERLQAYALANAENTLVLAKKAIDANYLTQCLNTQIPTLISSVSGAAILSVSGAGKTCLITLRVFSTQTDSTPRQLISTYFVNQHRQRSLTEIIEK